MEEILFRAKAINRNPNREYRSNYKNGDWVFGLLTRKKETFDDDYVLCAEMTDLQGISGIDVEMDTLGQFTGKCDKNGKKIFEGDILDDRKENDCVGVIVFEDAAFRVKWYGITTMLYPYGYDDAGFGELETEHLDMYYIDKFEVIGNIYDNPELMEGV